MVMVAILLLLVVAVRIAFLDADSGAFTMDNFKDLYGDKFVFTALKNTAGFTAVSTLTALAFAVPIAFLAERTTLPGRGLIFPLMLVTVLIPGFFGAMGWLLMFHPRIGMMNKWAIEYIPGIDGPIFNVVTVHGMGFITGLGLTSLAFIMLAGSFRAMDPALEESAQIHGMGLTRRLRRISFPLVWPGILAAGLYITTIGMASFDVPAFIGLSNRIFTFSTMMFLLANPENEPPRFGVIGASSIMMIFVALLLSWWYFSVIKRSHKYAVVTGKNYRPKLIDLNKRWIALGWGLISVKIVFSFVIPLVMLIWASLLPFFEPISRTAMEKVSLDNYRLIPWEVLWLPLKNTLILTLVVPTALVFIGLAVSWVVIRSKAPGVWAVDAVAFLPHAVPNLIFAVSILYMALFWMPDFVPLHGTIWIMVIVFVIARVSFPTRVYNNALLQIHKELDEAGYVFGLGPLRVLYRVIFPLLLPTILYSWIWMALLTYRELTLAAFLTSAENITLPVYILSIFGTDRGIAAAASIIQLLVMTPLIIAYFLWARRRGAVPS
jgi:iron(III) transport system permease protein